MRDNPLDKLDRLLWDKYRGKPVKRVGIDYLPDKGTVLTITLPKTREVTVVWNGKGYTLKLGRKVESYTRYTDLKKRVVELIEAA